MQFSLTALKSGDSRRLFFGQLISQACDKMMSVGLVWMFAVRYATDILPWFLGFSALPHLCLAWKAGPWATRWGQIRTLVATDLFRAVLYSGLAVAWVGLGPSHQLASLFAVSFAANIGSAFFNPAILATPVVLAEKEELQQLTAMVDSCFSLGNILGPLLCALLYPWIGLRGLFLFNGISYGLAAVLEAGIRPRSTGIAGDAPAETPDSPLQILSGDWVIAMMLVGFLASNLFLAPLMVFLPLFVKSAYHGNISLLASLETALGLGTVAGGLFLSTFRLDSRIGLKIAVGMAAVAVTYLGFVVSPSPWFAIVCLATLGFFLAVTNVFSMTLFQTRLAPRNIVTLMSLVNLISVASLPLSMTAIGMVVGFASIEAIALVCGASLLAVTLVVISQHELRAL
jgi:MFS family permease